MSLPTVSDVHTNVPLTDFSVQYAQADTKFCADKLAPIIASDKQTNLFKKFTKGYWARNEMRPRGPGTAAVETGYGIEDDSFACVVYAASKLISDQVRANEDGPLNSDRNATQFLMQQERILRENSFVTACMATSKWTTDKTGVAGVPAANQFKQWNDSASTPIENIRAYCTAAELLTLGAARPNVLAMGQEVWDALADHPDIVDRLKYGGQLTGSLARVTTEMVAALLGLEEVMVLGAVENTALEGGTAAQSFVAGKKALLLHRNTSPSIESITSVRTFTWRLAAGNDGGWKIKKMRDELRASDVIEIESAFVHKIVAADSGVYLASVVA